MVHIKSHSLKFVVFLFFLSQVQARIILLEKSDNPFDELFREIYKSVSNISEKIHLKLTDGDVHINTYFKHLKEIFQKAHGSVEKLENQMFDVVHQQIERVGAELIPREKEIGEKVKKLKSELADLKGDPMKLYEEIKKPFLEHFNQLKDDIKNKTKPIVNRWTPIIKYIEEIVLALIPKEKKEIKEN